jgi:F0F1-type ATP synthase assembly protein I
MRGTATFVSRWPDARGSTILADDPEGPDPRREMMRASGQFMGHGLTWALAVLLFLGIGAWVDSKIGTAPILTIVGAFVGGGAGFYSLYYHIVIEPRERDHDPQ